MSSKISVSITISGDDLNFDECTNIVGVAPSNTFVRKYHYDSSLVPVCQWSYTTQKIELESINDAVTILLKKLEPSLPQISIFANTRDYQIEFACSVDVYEDRPLYELSCETITHLAVLRARFSMEIHDFTEAAPARAIKGSD